MMVVDIAEKANVKTSRANSLDPWIQQRIRIIIDEINVRLWLGLALGLCNASCPGSGYSVELPE